MSDKARRTAADRVRVDEERLRHHRAVFVSAVFEAEHPVVHVHTVSGERALLRGHFVEKLVGVSSIESTRIFELLQNRVTRLENTVRWTWKQDDEAMWDFLMRIVTLWQARCDYAHGR